MILKHCITFLTPMGEQIIPQVIENQDLDGWIQSLTAQGVNPKNIKIKTDIELEEGEYEIQSIQ